MESGYQTELLQSQASTSSASSSTPNPFHLNPRNRVKPSTYEKDYLFSKDIMCQAQKVTCCFLKDVKGLGFMDSASELKDITVGSKMELPLWMAKCLKARKCISIETPKGYNETYREVLEADSSVVDLHKHGPHYYQFGKHLAQDLGLKDRVAIADSMVSTFHQRIHTLFDQAMNTSQDTKLTLLDYQSRLDSDELDILQEGKKATDDFKKWETRQSDKLVANEMVASLNRRKRALLMDLSLGNNNNGSGEAEGPSAPKSPRDNNRPTISGTRL